MHYLRQFFWVLCLLLVACATPSSTDDPSNMADPSNMSDTTDADDPSDTTDTTDADDPSDTTDATDLSDMTNPSDMTEASDPETNLVIISLDAPSSDVGFVWQVSKVEGNEQVAELDTANPAWSLSVGTRYRILNSDPFLHPFELVDASRDALLSQRSGGSFADDAEVNFIDNEDVLEFTFTQELAAQATAYICINHASMQGDISTAP